MKTEKKKKTKKWTKKRHSVVFAILWPIFRLIFKIRYGYKPVAEEKRTPKPCLIMANHLTTMDPFMLALSFHRPIYYITSEDLFTIPVISPIIRWLVAPIPKSKSRSDLNTIRHTLRVLKEGGTVAVFPEGNRSLSGGNWQIDEAAAKLAKLAKVPLVLYHIDGGYGADPRWGKGVRKGKMCGYVVEIVPAEKLAEMSVEEIHEKIVTSLQNTDIGKDIPFKNKRRAEYLERALYACPSCGRRNVLRSEKTEIFCKECGLRAEYTETLGFRRIQGALPYKSVEEWFRWQKVHLEIALPYMGNEEILFSDESVEVRRILQRRKRKNLGKADISATKQGLSISYENGENATLAFAETLGATVVGKRKINFYLPDGDVLQVKGSERFNSIKYLHVHDFMNSRKETVKGNE